MGRSILLTWYVRSIRERTDPVQILEMRSPDVRAELYANALKMGKKSSNETRAALFRMRLCVAILAWRLLIADTYA